MSRKRMLADVLWEAANTFLSPKRLDLGIKRDRYEYSCHAFNRALHGHRHDLNQGHRFLHELGCCFYYIDCLSWHDFDAGSDLQGVRYMWLLLAMKVAEDEGIEA